MLKQQYNHKFKDGDIIKKESNLTTLKNQQLHVLIETVNPNEFYAVMMQMKEEYGVTRYAVKDPADSTDNTSYYLVGKWGDAEIPVVIIQTEQGSDDDHASFDETKKALSWLPNLKYIFAVGVCGGVKGKVELGDVVVSKVIQDYSDMKVKDSKMIIRSDGYRCTGDDFYHFLSRAANKPENTKCGVVLSANWLVADDNFQRQMLKASPDAIAFEMEGHGIARACKKCKKEIIEFLIVKGVSDLADVNKDKDWQPQAATNAAKALCKAMAASDFFGKIINYS